MRAAAAAVSLLLGAGLWAQPAPVSRWYILERVRQKVLHALVRVPNYTCSENITRKTFHGNPPELTRMDRVRLEVAVIDRGEIFAWPGSSAFEKHDPSEVVFGSISSGEYASILAAVFQSGATSYKVAVDESLAGRRVVRYDYAVTEPRYTLRSGAASADLPYHGSFWVDPGKEQLLALLVRLDAIPDSLDYSEVTNLIDYGILSFDGQEFPFPTASEITAKYRTREQEVRNRIVFTGCRKYTGESKITFGEDVELPAGSVSERRRPSFVPAGLTVELALDKPISVASAAGDPVSATLTRPLRSGNVAIPAGARLTGRVLRCEISYRPVPYADIVFQFFDVSFGGTSLSFLGSLRSFDRLRGVRDYRPVSRQSIRARELQILERLDWRHSADFVLTGETVEIPAGFRMKWQTGEPGS